MSSVKNFLFYSIALGVAGSAIAFTDLRAGKDVVETSYTIQIQSKYLVINSFAEAQPEQSTNFLESYFNPFSLSVVDSQLDRYSTFAVNNALLNWENGFAVQTTKGDLFLCQTKILDMESCVKIYKFMKHGMSKNPYPEIG